MRPQRPRHDAADGAAPIADPASGPMTSPAPGPGPGPVEVPPELAHRGPVDPSRMIPVQMGEGVGRPYPAFWEEARRARKANYDIDPIFLSRWSPRSMTGERLARHEFMPLFEAARWAPSSFNSQFWRFIVAERGSEAWEPFLGLLTEGNRSWAKEAGLLVIMAGRRTHPPEKGGKEGATWSFDCGAAWENLALEGARRGLVVHGMEGFDYDRARDVARLPEDFEVLAMCAIGKRAPRERLAERHRKAEHPNQRLALDEIVHFHAFGVTEGEREVA